MARQSLNQKVSKVFKLFEGLRDPRVAHAMNGYGMDKDDIEEGRALIAALTEVKFASPPAKVTGATTFEKLDLWENRWFPIANASIERRHPAVHAQLFANLKQAVGAEAMMTVSTFVSRYDQMAAGEGGYGDEGKAAAQLLAKRSLTAAVVDEARALLAELGDVERAEVAPILTANEREAMDRAETELWKWYREWSRIARQAVTQPALLRALGLGKKSKVDEEEPDVTPAPVSPA